MSNSRFNKFPALRAERVKLAGEVLNARKERNKARQVPLDIGELSMEDAEELRKMRQAILNAPAQKLFAGKARLREDFGLTDFLENVSTKKGFERMRRTLSSSGTEKFELVEKKFREKAKELMSAVRGDLDSAPALCNDFISYFDGAEDELREQLYSLDGSLILVQFEIMLRYLDCTDEQILSGKSSGLLTRVLRIRGRLLQFLENNIHQIDRQAKTEALLTAPVLLMKYGSEAQQDKGKSIFRAYQDFAAPDKRWQLNDSLTAALIATGTPENASRAVGTLMELVDEKGQTPQVAGTLQELHDFPKAVSEKGSRAFAEIWTAIARKYQLPASELYEAWFVSNRSHNNRVIENNTRALLELEGREPGTAKYMYENFGIASFARYPREFLLQQKESADKNNLPYGIVIFPRNDHNGAFYEMNFQLRAIMESLKGKYYIRAFECESTLDIARDLLKCDIKYGNKYKISFALLGGHGTPDSIRFGGRDRRHSLHIEDLAGKGVKKTKRFFEEGATIILASCSTGAKNGIARRMRDDLDLNLIAPDKDAAIRKMEIREIDGRLDFSVDYTTAESILYNREKEE